MSYYDLHTGKSKFRQDGTYFPKEPNQTVLDWRNSKGFIKDRSKHRTWCKCGRYLKSVGNRQHRRWVRKMICHDRFDEIHFHQDMFVSSWDAC